MNGPALARVLDVDHVMQTGHRPYVEPRVEVDGEVDTLHWRGDALWRGGGTGRRIQPRGIRGGERRSRIEGRSRRVAGRDGQRQAQRIACIAERQRLEIADLHGYRGMRRNVGHRRGEHVRALLLHDARALTRLPRRGVSSLGQELFLNLAAYGAATDGHEQLIDRRIRGQGKDIQSFHPILAAVREGLNHAHAGDGAGDLRPHDRRHPQRLRGLGNRR